MRAILQRVEKTSVDVDQQVVGAIDRGLLVLLGVEHGDTEREVEVMAEKLIRLRCFEDADGKMNLDAAQAGGSFLVVSQFTLAASLRKGRRPSFDRAARPDLAEPLVEALMNALRGHGFRVEGGRFGAHMKVHLINDGPVTFVLDVRDGKVV